MQAIDNKQVIDSTNDEIAQIARIDTLRHNVGTIVFQITPIDVTRQRALLIKQPKVEELP